MRADRYLWIAISILLCPLGGHVLIDSVRHSGPYDEEYILLGGTLFALGLAAMFFAFKQHAQIKALAQHMSRASRSSRGPKKRRIENNS